VYVGIGVLVDVGTLVGIGVFVDVGVLVGTGVLVDVGALVGIGVFVGVGSTVSVGIGVLVEAGTSVGAAVGTAADVGCKFPPVGIVPAIEHPPIAHTNSTLPKIDNITFLAFISALLPFCFIAL